MNYSSDRERHALAADIARRVRLFSWQPMPSQLAEALGDFGWAEQGQLFTPHHSVPVLLRLDYMPRPARLTMSFDIGPNYNVGRVLWTPEDNP